MRKNLSGRKCWNGCKPAALVFTERGVLVLGCRSDCALVCAGHADSLCYTWASPRRAVLSPSPGLALDLWTEEVYLPGASKVRAAVGSPASLPPFLRSR